MDNARGMTRIPFNKAHVTGREVLYISEAQAVGQLTGQGRFTRRCSDWLGRRTGAAEALLTHSCTAALEMSALLCDVGPGDEVIMPAYTYVSTANAFALRGARPVFVDIRPDTLNLDETKVAAAITPRTRVIVPVHYAGVGCEMDTLLALARRHDLLVVEDAAQGILAGYRGRPLGSMGAFGSLSFHETKNISCGKGGALLINDTDRVARGERIHQCGTDRRGFERGEVARYTWQDLGSAFCSNELSAAYLWAQMEEADSITGRRLALWHAYHDALAAAESEGRLRRPVVPAHCQHNGHMYYVLLPERAQRDRVLERLRRQGIHAVFHYVPLHSAPAGQRLGRSATPLPVTEDIAGRLLRLPLWPGMEGVQPQVIEALLGAL